ncbi:hypothetical protein JVU11DRAFT_7669 [Chiua virens]|nr:hypothetical protein JVU11DRAFT_7669 [Chiua virens]
MHAYIPPPNQSWLSISQFFILQVSTTLISSRFLLTFVKLHTTNICSSSEPGVPPPLSGDSDSDSISGESSNPGAAEWPDLQSILSDHSLRPEERQRIFELRMRELMHLASSRSLHLPLDLILAYLPNASGNELANIVQSCQTLMHPAQVEPSTSVFCSLSSNNLNLRKTRKIDKIKKRFISMLREIGFQVPEDRLPWSTLEEKLRERGYTILNWPEGVIRENDKGVYSLSAEDAAKLYRALFSTQPQGQLQFVHCIDEITRDGEGSMLPIVTDAPSHSDGASDAWRISGRACTPSARKRKDPFRVMTPGGYGGRKRRRVN